ncbi:MAG: HlyC/CorC family transporter [Gemmatimonadaceae bacterium]|nr:HlyC/CorC family transporter [Gemmatimonadaceae bacterium]
MSSALTVILLLLLNGFFVAVEFALVRSRRTRLEAMVRGGDRVAGIALRATGNLTKVLSASQLGITLASLGLGWVAERVLGALFEHWFANLPVAIDASLRVSIAAAVALTVATFMHVVFGELAPRAAALNHPEVVAKWLAPPLLVFAWLTAPFTWVLNRSAEVVLRLFGQQGSVSEETVHSPDELRMLVEHAEEGGAIQPQDAELIEGVFEFSEKNAREVMTPRTAVVAMPVESTIDEACAIVEESNFSRYPVYEDSLDNVVGIVLAKDLLRAVRRNTEGFELRQIMREVHVVPGSREVEEVLSDFKRRKEHMAIVLDEFGGTAGIVTMEDLLEEIVGEILDEYDEPERRASTSISGETLIPGETHVTDVNEAYGLGLTDEDYTTIGGYVFGALGRLPQLGDRVVVLGTTLTVREMDGRRIKTIALGIDGAGADGAGDAGAAARQAPSR